VRRVRYDRLAVEIWRGAVIKRAPDGVMSGAGTLVVGFRWPAYLVEKTLLAVEGRALLTVNGHFTVHTGCKIVVDAGATLEIGSGYMNSNSNINCFNSITIGQHVFIAENVSIRDSDNHALSGGSRAKDGPIFIGDHVWIGTKEVRTNSWTGYAAIPRLRRYSAGLMPPSESFMRC
jgi:hypothetical protein